MLKSINEFNSEEMEILRSSIQELTGYDIKNSTVSNGSRNTNYVISQSTRPVAIRVSPCFRITAEEMHSELLFIDYLKQFVSTICQPVPVKNSLINKISIGDNDFYVVVFRKGNGWFENDPINPDYIVAAAELLGKLHNASVLANREGFKYKRNDWNTITRFQIDRNKLSKIADNQTLDEMQKVIDTIQSLPKDDNTYGMIHGDFVNHNLFLDWDNAWIFDFDDCCYNFYMFDICTILLSPFIHCHMFNEADKFSQYVSTVRTAYDKGHKMDDEQWSDTNIRLFICLRIIDAINIMNDTEEADSPSFKQYVPLLLKTFKDCQS